MKKNWVNEALDDAARVVAAWPEWMKRPEVRFTREYLEGAAGGPRSGLNPEVPTGRGSTPPPSVDEIFEEMKAILREMKERTEKILVKLGGDPNG